MQIKIAAFLLIALIGATLNACDKINAIPGKIQGTLLNEGGSGRGYLSVRLIDTEVGGEAAYQMNAEDTGNFMFEAVDPGTYHIEVWGAGHTPKQYQCTDTTVKVTPGKTLMVQITVGEEIPQEEK